MLPKDTSVPEPSGFFFEIAPSAAPVGIGVTIPSPAVFVPAVRVRSYAPLTSGGLVAFPALAKVFDALSSRLVGAALYVLVKLVIWLPDVTLAVSVPSPLSVTVTTTVFPDASASSVTPAIPP